MIVICIEGCHGSGKTSIIKQLASAGFNVLDEAFLDMPTYIGLHPQTLIMESLWVARWLERLLLIQKKEGSTAKETIYFADRSPYSAVFYSNYGHLLEPLIEQQIKDLQKANIYIFSVVLKVEEQRLWRRIQTRLVVEPERRNLQEGSYDWMKKVLQFYQDKQNLWNFYIENNDNTIPELMHNLILLLTNKVQRFNASCCYVASQPYITSTVTTPPSLIASVLIIFYDIRINCKRFK